MSLSATGPIDKSHLCKSPEECIDYYDRSADTYDLDSENIEYNGPKLLSEVCLKFLTNKDAKILDFLCGTGALADSLATHGYENIDGLDGSQKMIEKANDKGRYRNLFTEILLPDRESEFLRQNYYDLVAGVGIFSPGHINADHLHHICKPAKKNGLIIFGIREAWIEKLNLDSKINEMGSLGVWKLLDKLKTPNYYREKVAAVFYVLVKL